MAKRRRFKARVALREEKTVQAIATRHQLHPNHMSQWKHNACEGLAEVFEGGLAEWRRAPKKEIRSLHAKIGQREVQRDLRSSARSLSRAQRRELVRSGDPRASLSLQCRLLGLSRSSLYYRAGGHRIRTRRIDELYLKYPFYGSPAELRSTP